MTFQILHLDHDSVFLCRVYLFFFGEMVKQTLGMRIVYDGGKIHQLGASFCKQTCAMALVWGRSSIICCIFSWICWEWYTFVFPFFVFSSFLVLREKLDLFNRVALCPIYFNFLLNKTVNDYIWSYGKVRWFFREKIRWLVPWFLLKALIFFIELTKGPCRSTAYREQKRPN